MAIKVLLIEDVDDLGRSGDIVNVKPGFARNYLLPNLFAVPADKSALRMQARLQEERRQKAIVDKQEAEKTATSLNGVVVQTVVKVDHEGHMYGSVTVNDVLQMLQEQVNIQLQKRDLALKHPIKEIGVHTIGIKLKEGVTSSITLKVLSEEGEAEMEAVPTEAAT